MGYNDEVRKTLNTISTINAPIAMNYVNRHQFFANNAWYNKVPNILEAFYEQMPPSQYRMAKNVTDTFDNFPITYPKPTIVFPKGLKDKDIPGFMKTDVDNQPVINDIGAKKGAKYTNKLLNGVMDPDGFYDNRTNTIVVKRPVLNWNFDPFARNNKVVLNDIVPHETGHALDPLELGEWRNYMRGQQEPGYGLYQRQVAYQMPKLDNNILYNLNRIGHSAEDIPPEGWAESYARGERDFRLGDRNSKYAEFYNKTNTGANLPYPNPEQFQSLRDILKLRREVANLEPAEPRGVIIAPSEKLKANLYDAGMVVARKIKGMSGPSIQKQTVSFLKAAPKVVARALPYAKGVAKGSVAGIIPGLIVEAAKLDSSPKELATINMLEGLINSGSEPFYGIPPTALPGGPALNVGKTLYDYITKMGDINKQGLEDAYNKNARKKLSTEQRLESGYYPGYR